MISLKYSELLSQVVPEVSGCSDMLVEQAIRDAAIEFCGASRVWRHLCDPVEVQARIAEYAVEIPSDTALVTILSASLQGRALTARTPGQLDEIQATWRTETGDPHYFTQVTPEDIVLACVPSTSAFLSVFVALQPSRKSTALPGWIGDRYQDAICAGAKSRLMRKQGQPWHNPQLAEIYRREFDEGVATAALSAQQSMVRAVSRTTPQH